MPLSPVSIANDIALPLIPLSMTFHNLIPVPPVPPVPPVGIYPCVEIPVMMMWPPGFGLQQNKLTTTVLHKFMFIVLDSHDCGYMIPHITIPANNAMLPMHIMFSSRKFMFSASTVKANSAAVGCTWPIMPMLCCAQPVSLPSGTALLNCLNTVIVGVTWMDVLAGAFAIGISMVADYLTRGAPANGPKDWAWKLLLGDEPKNWLAKTVLAAEAGAIRIAATGEGSIQIGGGSGFLGGNVTFSKSSDGSWSLAIAGSGGVPLPVGDGAVGGQASAQYTHNADGTTSHATSTTVSGADGNPVAAIGGSHTTTHTTTYNPDGSVASDSTDTTDSAMAATPLGGRASGETTTTDNAPGTGVPAQSGSGSPTEGGSGSGPGDATGNEGPADGGFTGGGGTSGGGGASGDWGDPL